MPHTDTMNDPVLRGLARDEVVRKAFDHLWREGYDGRDLAMSFVRVAAGVVREECPADMEALRGQVDHAYPPK
jgi:hypothetical protein